MNLTVYDLLFILCSSTMGNCYLHEDVLQVPLPEISDQNVHDERIRSYDFDWLKVRFVPELPEV